MKKIHNLLFIFILIAKIFSYDFRKKCNKNKGECMLNYIWAVMILIGIIVGTFTGKITEISNASINSAKEAVTLCITMLGVMSFWMGLMEVAKKAGIIKALTKAMTPIIHFFFPRLPKEHIVNEYIASNMIANVLGLGWAATPMGLKAMEALGEINEERCRKNGTLEKGGAFVASNEMCTFLILNISSLQLIPVNIIAYRSQYGSINPTEIIIPAIVATFVSTIVAAIFCKVMDFLEQRKGRL